MELQLPSDDEIRELARRMGGGHPIAEIRGEEHVIIHNTPVEIPLPEVVEMASEEVSTVEKTVVPTTEEDEACKPSQTLTTNTSDQETMTPETKSSTSSSETTT